MPRALKWSAAQDTLIRGMRGTGASWDAIAEALRVNRWTASERGRHLGVKLPEPKSEPTRESRAPLPAGHPIPWGAITASTCLAGQAYPLPVFL